MPSKSEAGGMTLDQALESLKANLDWGTISFTERIQTGGEPAILLGIKRTKQKDFVYETIVLHGGNVWVFLFFGSDSKMSTANKQLCGRILETVEFPN